MLHRMDNDSDGLDFLDEATPWAVKPRSQAKPDGCAESDIFSHRNQFDSIARDRIEHEKQRAARAQLHEDKKEQRRKEKTSTERTGSVKREDGDAEETCGLKKRRINSAESARLLADVNLSVKAAIELEDDDAKLLTAASPAKVSTRNDRTRRKPSPFEAKSSRTNDACDPNIRSDSDDVEIIATEPQAAPSQPPPPEDEEDSDPEIAALARTARENARRRYELAKKAGSPDGAIMEQGGCSLPPRPDPAIQVFVTSCIPGTNPLIVRRKLSQNLQRIREVWCQKQGFDQAVAAQVFLTYCGRKVYDSTTVKRLGITVDEAGGLYRADDPYKEGVENVHVEATTEELYQAMKAEKARQYQAAQDQCFTTEGAEDEGESEAAKESIRVVIQAKDRKECTARVSRESKIQQLIAYGKRRFGLADSQDVYIEFDGERLAPEQVIGDTEIGDMDQVGMFHTKT